MSQSFRSEVQLGMARFSGSHKVEIKVLVDLCSFMDTLGKNALPNPFRLLAEISSFRYRTEVFVTPPS